VPLIDTGTSEERQEISDYLAATRDVEKAMGQLFRCKASVR